MKEVVGMLSWVKVKSVLFSSQLGCNLTQWSYLCESKTTFKKYHLSYTPKRSVGKCFKGSLWSSAHSAWHLSENKWRINEYKWLLSAMPYVPCSEPGIVNTQMSKLKNPLNRNWNLMAAHLKIKKNRHWFWVLSLMKQYGSLISF